MCSGRYGMHHGESESDLRKGTKVEMRGMKIGSDPEAHVM